MLTANKHERWRSLRREATRLGLASASSQKMYVGNLRVNLVQVEGARSPQGRTALAVIFGLLGLPRKRD